MESKNWQPYAIVPASLLEMLVISTTEKIVLIALMTYSNSAGESWPSLSKLSQRAGISRRSTERALNSLESKYFITRIRRRDVVGRPDSTLYQVRDNLTLYRDNLTHGIGSGCRVDRDRMAPELYHITKPRELKKKTSKKPPGKAFGEFKNVILTDTEFQALLTKWGNQQATLMIEKLSSYKEANGKEYKRDFAVFGKWVADACHAVPLETSLPDTLPKATCDMTCPRCKATVPRGDIACPECNYFVADMGRTA